MCVFNVTDFECEFYLWTDLEFTKSGSRYQIHFLRYPPVNTPTQIVELEKFDQVFPKPKYVIIFGDHLACSFVDRFKKSGMYLLDLAQNNSTYDLYVEHMSEIFDVYESFADETSRRVFLAFMLGKVSGRSTDFIYDPMPQYFLEGFMPKSGDILIDGGAFDGSSGSMFKKYGCEVYAFELDARNFSVAVERGKKEGFTVENFGLGEYSHEIKYASASFGSHIEENGNATAKIISIDEYVEMKNLPRVDFIKLDVEGSELDTLKGAAVSIARWKPRLALSAYHRFEDIFTLYEFLKSIRPDYEFAFRHYATDYRNEPSLFGERGKMFLEKHKLPLKIPYVWEAVLYAR